MTTFPNFEIVITGLLGIMLLGSIVSKRLRIPYTIVLVIIGILLAASSLSTVLGISRFYNNYLGSLFVGLVIPPLLFESMMGIRSVEFRSSIRLGLILATAGVLLSTVVGGLILWKIVGLPAYDSFLFSSLISPTDTASVLELFRRLNVPRRLATIMDSEAAFNDATGVIVFSIVLTSGSVSHLALLRGLGEFMFVFGGGLLVGLSVGFGAEIISSLIDDPLSEAVLSISIVYGAYALATSLGFSGLVAVAVSGLYYGNVTMRSVIQPLSRSAVKTFWRILAYIANSVAFLFIGLNTDLINLANAFLIILIASVTVFVSRMVAVYPIMHIFGRRDGIPSWWNNTIVAGGMRGAISVVLIASIPTDVPLRSTIATLVLGVVFISVIFQGPFLSRYIERHFERGREESRVTQSIHNDLSEAGVEIARLSSEWEERSISDEELAAGLERERDRLTGLITDVNRSMNPGEIMRSRALSLYRSMTGFRRRDGRSDEQKEDIGIGENGDKGRKEN